MLVLHECYGGDGKFLDSAAALCRTFHAAPVVLTVAGSETKARQGQQRAQEIMARHQLDADFDFLVGGDMALGVAAAAGWRHCGHLLVPQHRATSWWRWFRPGIIEHLPRLPNSLTLLVLPPAVARDLKPASQDLELVHNQRN
jgi:K+-sensing histidine kinase KdpD